MFNIGPPELLVVLIIALLVFGPRQLPEVGRTIGRSLREFRRASDEIRQELRFDLDDDDPALGDLPKPPATGSLGDGGAPARPPTEGGGSASASTPGPRQGAGG